MAGKDPSHAERPVNRRTGPPDRRVGKADRRAASTAARKADGDGHADQKKGVSEIREELHDSRAITVRPPSSTISTRKSALVRRR
jgi:hypothetical protein